MMTDRNKLIAVIGAGIVGCSCALWLQKKGFSVTLIDPDDPGSGTSSGNACTIADYGCVPVNSPGIFKRLPRLMFANDSPLSVNPAYALTHPSWSLAFLRNCSAHRVARISHALGDLLANTYEGLEPLIKMASAEQLLRQQGCIYVYASRQEFNNAAESNQLRADQGNRFIELDSADLQSLEPNLKKIFVKGLLFEKASQVVDPQALATRYFECFMKNLGRAIRQRALAVEHRPDGVKIDLDNGEQVEAGGVVIAAGAFSRTIRGIGADKLPLDTERGYHLQYSGQQHLLNRPVSWNEAGFYATPMARGLRIAGTVEIAGYSCRKNPRNLAYLARKGHEMLDLPDYPDQDWLGYRPSFPDALPAIGYSPVSDKILFAFGHQHIGLTLAGITGKLIAELASEQPPSQNIEAFNPARFS